MAGALFLVTWSLKNASPPSVVAPPDFFGVGLGDRTHQALLEHDPFLQATFTPLCHWIRATIFGDRRTRNF
jgi:hypothetical protein